MTWNALSLVVLREKSTGKIVQLLCHAVLRYPAIKSSSSKRNLKLKTKADIEPGGSPKPPTKHYTPLSSPQVHNDVIQEIRGEIHSLFNTSPLLGKKPRSPKIHPSPRLKRTGYSDKHSPIKTKHDLLTRKRKDKCAKASDDRVVMGAPDVPVFHEKPHNLKSPDSTGSITPTGKAEYFDEGTLKRAKGSELNESEKSSDANTIISDSGQDKKGNASIQLEFVDKTEHETRNPGSGTSDDSCSPEKVHADKEQTTSFIEEPKKDPKPRRPTSLIETYQKPCKSISLPSINKGRHCYS